MKKTYEPATLVELGGAHELILGETAPFPDNAMGSGQNDGALDVFDE